jgi:hypothetical protein
MVSSDGKGRRFIPYPLTPSPTSSIIFIGGDKVGWRGGSKFERGVSPSRCALPVNTPGKNGEEPISILNVL